MLLPGFRMLAFGRSPGPLLQGSSRQPTWRHAWGVPFDQVVSNPSLAPSEMRAVGNPAVESIRRSWAPDLVRATPAKVRARLMGVGLAPPIGLTSAVRRSRPPVGHEPAVRQALHPLSRALRAL